MATVEPHQLPALKWKATPNQSTRHGEPVRRVVVHRWGVKLGDEKAAYEGVIRYFTEKAPGGNPAAAVSAHVVYPGSAVPGQATQMVPWHLKAWTEAHYNPDSVEIESADAIWLGKDKAGFQQLAHMVAWMLHHWSLPPTKLTAATVASERGFCRHADLGLLGGGHTSCPTTQAALWDAFAAHVKAEYQRGPGRLVWGR